MKNSSIKPLTITSLQEQLKATAKKLKWAVNKISTQLVQATFGGPEFFKELYKNIQEIQGRLAELWDQSFTKEVVEEHLEVKIADWDSRMLKLAEFLKDNQIENEKAKELQEEVELLSKMNSFGNQEEPQFGWNYISTLEDYQQIQTQNIHPKNNTSFFGYFSTKFSLVEENAHLYSGEIPTIKLKNPTSQGIWIGDISHTIKDAVYSSSENAYFFCTELFLYKKNLDRRKARKVLDINTELLTRKRSLKYSEQKTRLLVNNGEKILIVDPTTRITKVESTIERPDFFDQHDFIADFTLLESENSLRVVLLSQNGWIALVDSAQGTVLKNVRYSLHQRYSFEEPGSMAMMRLCSSQKYLLVAMCGFGYNPSNFDLYEIKENSIELRQGIKVEAKEGKLLSTSKPFYYGEVSGRSDHLIFSQKLERKYITYEGQWLAYGREYLGVVDFNLRTGELRLVQTDLGKIVASSNQQN